MFNEENIKRGDRLIVRIGDVTIACTVTKITGTMFWAIWGDNNGKYTHTDCDYNMIICKETKLHKAMH